MYTLTTAEPDFRRAGTLRNSIQDRTLKSLDYLLSIAENLLKEDMGRKRKSLKLLEGKRCNGLLYAYHDRLYKLIKSQQLEKMSELINGVDISHCISLTLDVIPLNSKKFSPIENETIFITAKESHDALYAKYYDCKKPTDANFQLSKQAIYTALAHIKQLDRECYDEFLELVTDVVICDSQVINAGTCFDTFGFLYVRQLNVGEDWLKYFEHLVHEAGHHYLYTVLAQDRLIKNTGKSQYYQSPLRKEKRPLNGIYQGMFVLARTIRAFNRMRNSADYSAWIPKIRTHYNNAENPASFEEKFADTYGVISKHADLTRVGKSLLEDCRKMANC